jgi:hypothetical protein
MGGNANDNVAVSLTPCRHSPRDIPLILHRYTPGPS